MVKYAVNIMRTVLAVLVLGQTVQAYAQSYPAGNQVAQPPVVGPPVIGPPDTVTSESKNNKNDAGKNVVVDDGGSLKMMPADQSTQYRRQRQGVPPQYDNLPRSDSTAVRPPPGEGRSPDLQNRLQQNEFESMKNQLPPEMQHLTPKQLQEEYQKSLDK
jgi:hypothetical protein